MENHLKPLPGTKTAKKNSSKSPEKAEIRRVLGIDPGIASTGWAIVDFHKNRYACVDYGVVETKPDTAHGERLLIIFTEIEKIIKNYQPKEAGMETLYFAKNVSSAMAVAEARGVITLCLSKNCILLGEYTPLVIKQSITGHAKAEKSLVQEYLQMLLGLSSAIKPDHASDAVGAAITHINSFIPS